MPGSVLSAKRRKRRPKLAADIRRQLLIPFFILLAVVLADQLTKLWALSYLSDMTALSVFGDFFRLKLTHNEGGAMGTNLGGRLFYLVTSSIILIVVLYMIVTNRSQKIISYPLAAISGGAIGNMIDRIRIGSVIDFIDVDFFDIDIAGFRLERWWTFNVADSAITVGMVIVLIYILFYSKKATPAAETESN
jgi:signal peptidase II